MRQRTFWVALSLLACGCGARTARPVPPSVPSMMLGSFVDDYGSRYRITATDWIQLPSARYRIVRWDVERQYLIAQNDSANPTDGGLWTRIDWVVLPAMPPWRWAYCHSAYRAPRAEVADTVSIARRETPRTGCNGHPFSRMQPDTIPPS